ncbi:MAG: OmpH family outer membrane protein [Deltaproteobacteria bacterium]|nr:OmpH family outer membrane protein [Deltaproteobacteria bacterium]
MKVRIIGMMVAACVFGFLQAAHGAEVAKIGVIDFQRIIDTSNAGKRSSEEIKRQGKKMEKVLKEKESEVEALKKEMEQKALVMSQEAKDEKERALRIKTNDLVSLRKRYLDTLKETNLKLSNQIKDDVFQIVEKMGKRGGYLLILEKRVGGVIYAPSAIDITDKVIQEYNAVDAKRREKKQSKD